MLDNLTITSPNSVVPPSSTSLQDTPLMSLIQELISVSDEKVRLECEKAIQRGLNEKVGYSQEELVLLQQHGYSITHNSDTIERFRSFSMPNEPELSQFIQIATPEGGLLIDRFKMYRPGPASAKAVNGAAKGYDEIFAIFETQANEKREIAEVIGNTIKAFCRKLPEKHPWKNVSTILDLGSGNGLQSHELLMSLETHFPGRSWNLTGLDNQKGCIEKSNALFQTNPVQSKGIFHFHDLFEPAPPDIRGRAEVIVVSHLYFGSERIPEFLERIHDYRAKNCLLVFIHGTTGTDGDTLANHHETFMRGKPSSNMSENFEKCLKHYGFRCKTFIEESLVRFPVLNQEIETTICEYKRGDYENPYEGIDENIKIFKALMEFYASFPLESMESNQRATYLEALKTVFSKNQEAWLKICDRVIVACPLDCDEDFMDAFNDMYAVDFNDYFAKAERAFLEGYKHKAADLLVTSLQAIHDRMIVNQLQKCELSLHHPGYLAQGLILLAAIHSQKGLFPQAVGLLCYAKQIVKKFGAFDKDKLIREIEGYIEQIEIKLIVDSERNKTCFGGMKQAKADRQEFESLREKTKEKFDSLKKKGRNLPEYNFELKSLFEEMTQDLKIFISKLVNDSIHLIGPPPCGYAFIGFGSFVQNEMTPFSNLEFAVLIEEENVNTKAYFRRLAVLLHLKIINLEETNLSQLSVEGLSIYDDITPQGFAIDGSLSSDSITPFIRLARINDDCPLICSPQSMSDLQTIKRPFKNQNDQLRQYRLSATLAQTTLICGSQNLVEQYEGLLSLNQSEEVLKHVFSFVLPIDLEKLTPQLEMEVSGRVQTVERDFDNLVNILFARLTDYYNLKSKSTFEKINELQEMGVLDELGAGDLKELVLLNLEWRFTTHFRHSGQSDELNEEYESILYDFYYRAFPFLESMQNFYSHCVQPAPDSPIRFDRSRFFSQSPYYRGLIEQRLMKYLQAEKTLEIESEKTVDYYILFGSIKQAIGKYSEAETCYEQALDLIPENTNFLKQALLNKKIGDLHKEMGCVIEEKTSDRRGYHQAKEILKRISPQNDQSTKALEKLFRAMAQLAIFQGRFVEAEESVKSSKKLVYKRTYSIPKDPRLNEIPDISLAANLELEATIEENIRCDHTKAKELLEAARKIYECYYGSSNHPSVIACERMIIFENDFYKKALDLELKHLNLRFGLFGTGNRHPDIARNMNRIGTLYRILGRFHEALHYHNQALSMQTALYHAEHAEIANSNHKIGKCYSEIGDYETALKHFEIALNLRRKSGDEGLSDTMEFFKDKGICLTNLGKPQDAFKMHKESLKRAEQLINNIRQVYKFNESHPSLASCMRNQADCLMRLGQYHPAIELLEKALEIQEQFYGKKLHPEVASTLESIGTCFYSLGKFKDALKHHKKALKIKEDIYGKNHFEIANSKTGIGNALSYLKQSRGAIECHREALAIREKVFGEDHPSVAISLINIASCLSFLQEHSDNSTCLEDARKNFKRALDIRIAALGDDHPDTVLSKHNLAHCESLISGIDPLVSDQITQMSQEEFQEIIEIAKQYLIEANLSELTFEKNPTGFVRLRLDVPPKFKDRLDSIRFNYWPRKDIDIELKVTEAQHTHPRYFESLILKGGYTHLVFEKITDDLSCENPSYRAHRMYKNTDKERNIFYIGGVSLRQTAEQELTAGAHVVFPRNLIHQVKSTMGGTLTVNCVFKSFDCDFFDVFIPVNSHVDPVIERETLSSEDASKLASEILEILNGYANVK